MNLYHTTGYNDHYMYLNVQQQTMPNGLVREEHSKNFKMCNNIIMLYFQGMGGQMEYFGLYLDSSYGTGMCSESCTTYHSPMMSGNKNFEMAHAEVWGLGKAPKTPAELVSIMI